MFLKKIGVYKGFFTLLNALKQFRHFEIEKTNLSFQDLHQAFGFSQRSGIRLL